MTAAEVLAAWQATAAGAQSGPWVADVRPGGQAWIDMPDVDGHAFGMHGWPGEAEFIALSRDALPRAVAAVQAVLALADEVADAPRTAQWVHRNRIQDAIDAALGVEP